MFAGAAQTLDLARPVAVLLLAVLHFLAYADDPAAVVAALARRLAPGSFVVISHLTGDFAPGPVTAGVEAYNALVPGPLVARSHAQVSALFGGLPLVPPGVVPVSEWRPASSARSPMPWICMPAWPVPLGTGRDRPGGCGLMYQRGRPVAPFSEQISEQRKIP